MNIWSIRWLYKGQSTGPHYLFGDPDSVMAFYGVLIQSPQSLAILRVANADGVRLDPERGCCAWDGDSVEVVGSKEAN